MIFRLWMSTCVFIHFQVERRAQCVVYRTTIGGFLPAQAGMHWLITTLQLFQAGQPGLRWPSTTHRYYRILIISGTHDLHGFKVTIIVIEGMMAFWLLSLVLRHRRIKGHWGCCGSWGWHSGSWGCETRRFTLVATLESHELSFASRWQSVFHSARVYIIVVVQEVRWNLGQCDFGYSQTCQRGFPLPVMHMEIINHDRGDYSLYSKNTDSQRWLDVKEYGCQYFDSSTNRHGNDASAAS